MNLLHIDILRTKIGDNGVHSLVHSLKNLNSLRHLRIEILGYHCFNHSNLNSIISVEVTQKYAELLAQDLLQIIGLKSLYLDLSE